MNLLVVVEEKSSRHHVGTRDTLGSLHLQSGNIERTRMNTEHTKKDVECGHWVHRMEAPSAARGASKLAPQASVISVAYSGRRLATMP